jgi:uncharacterized membrane protein
VGSNPTRTTNKHGELTVTLQNIADRLESIMSKIKSGEVKITEESFEQVDKLEVVISEYEEILKKENTTMSDNS